MEDVKIRYCNLCLTTIPNEENFLMLKLGFDDDSKHEVCNVCSAKLSTAQKFKLTCSFTDNTINSYANITKVLPLDLIDIYKKERGSDHLSDNVKICRLCMQPINMSEFIAINKEHIDMIRKLVPGMKIFIIKEPVMCKICQNSLAEHCDLLTKCWNIKQNTVYTSNEQGRTDLSHVPQVKVSTKIEDIDEKLETAPQLTKIEYVDVNSMKIENESEIPGQEITSEGAASMSNCETTLESEDSYKCEQCDYTCRVKIYLTSHMLKHKDPSEVPIYKCENCDYQTKYRTAIKRHILIHKKPEVEIYHCEHCNYETRHKHNFRNHASIHKDRSEKRIYKCDICVYESLYKGALKRHMLVHKDPLEVQ